MKRQTSKYKKYKDSVFCMLFSDQNKLRELYNTITGSSYSKETPMTINTLQETLGIGLKNDISFTIGDKTIVLIEHQSTINPNMPIRFLLYVAALYEKMILRKELYAERGLELPNPEFYLFYNGKAPYPEETTLRLSQAFKKRAGIEEGIPDVVETNINFCTNLQYNLELEVKVYNINLGHNKRLMAKNRDLGEFAKFVEIVREKQAGLTKKEELEEAFRLAIKECIEHNILRKFLETHGEEVMKSLLKITREEYIELRLESAREIGKEEGLAKAKLETARKLKTMRLSLSQIAEATGLPIEEVEKL
ncbi:MAG: Rpn family recombination-promoting nuclease/putative transposase [Spirochaetes bacterium]|nr:Rpn family recombination-promoting nuclease/putative transposase [Spirochaetota bacterium]